MASACLPPPPSYTVATRQHATCGSELNFIDFLPDYKTWTLLHLVEKANNWLKGQTRVEVNTCECFSYNAWKSNDMSLVVKSCGSNFMKGLRLWYNEDKDGFPKNETLKYWSFIPESGIDVSNLINMVNEFLINHSDEGHIINMNCEVVLADEDKMINSEKCCWSRKSTDGATFYTVIHMFFVKSSCNFPEIIGFKDFSPLNGRDEVRKVHSQLVHEANEWCKSNSTYRVCNFQTLYGKLKSDESSTYRIHFHQHGTRNTNYFMFLRVFYTISVEISSKSTLTYAPPMLNLSCCTFVPQKLYMQSSDNQDDANAVSANYENCDRMREKVMNWYRSSGMKVVNVETIQHRVDGSFLFDDQKLEYVHKPDESQMWLHYFRVYVDGECKLPDPQTDVRHLAVDEEISDAGDQMSALSMPSSDELSFKDFLPRNGHDTLNLLVNDANDWLKQKETVFVRCCECLMCPASDDNTIDPNQSIHFCSATVKTTYYKILRVWYTYDETRTRACKILHYFFVPNYVNDVGYCPKETSELVRNINTSIRDMPEEGRLLNIYTEKIPSSHEASRCIMEYALNEKWMVNVFVLHLFYLVSNSPCKDTPGPRHEIKFKDFAASVHYRETNDYVSNLVDQVRSWCQEDGTNKKIVCIQTVDTKLSFFDVFCDRLYYPVKSSSMRFTSFVRVVYYGTSANDYVPLTSSGELKLVSRTFFPECIGSGYESVEQLRKKISSWTKLTEGKLLGVETIHSKMCKVHLNTDIGSYEINQEQDQTWITGFRIYLDTYRPQVREFLPSPPTLSGSPPSPSFINANMYAISPSIFDANLAFFDFIPQVSIGIPKPPLSDLISMANDCLKRLSDVEVKNCEFITYPCNYGDVETGASSFSSSCQYKTRFMSILRVWYTPTKKNHPVDKINFFSWRPMEKNGGFETIMDVLKRLNRFLRTNPKVGRVMNVQTEIVKNSNMNSFIESERCVWTYDPTVTSTCVQILRVFCLKCDDDGAKEDIGIKDFVPRYTGHTFTELVGEAGIWCEMNRVRICNFQTVYAKVKNSHVVTERVQFGESSDHDTNYSWFLRLVHAKPTDNATRDIPDVNVVYGTFEPRNSLHETFSLACRKMCETLQYCNIDIICAETIALPSDNWLPDVEACSWKRKNKKDLKYVLVNRVYLDDQAVAPQFGPTITTVIR